MAKGIRSLMDCVAQALPQVGNLSVLFILLFYIFSALGVELFGKIGINQLLDFKMIVGVGAKMKLKIYFA